MLISFIKINKGVYQMTKEDFINTLEEYLEETGLSEGAFNSYFSVSTKKILILQYSLIKTMTYGSPEKSL